MDHIRKLTKQSLRKRLSEFLSQDWLHEANAHHFPLQKYYVQLEWVKKKKEATSIKMENISGLDELIMMESDEPGTILVEGNLIVIFSRSINVLFSEKGTKVNSEIDNLSFGVFL